MTERSIEVDFKPSDIDIRVPLPFVGTFNHSESEFMASILVATLASMSDAWGPVTPSAASAWMKKKIDDDFAWAGVLAIISPDPLTLVLEGFCQWVGEADGRGPEFTDKGLAALSKWAVTPEERAIAPEDLATMRGSE